MKWNTITLFLAGLMLVSVMLVMFVDLLRWVELHQKVLAITGKMLTHHLNNVCVVSLKLNGY